MTDSAGGLDLLIQKKTSRRPIEHVSVFVFVMMTVTREWGGPGVPVAAVV
jgi:hypothetical protein